jgi:hypothetical protein
VRLPVLVSVDDDAPLLTGDDTPQLMPNPANDVVRIRVVGTSALEIVDLHGRVVLHGDLVSGSNEIAVADLAQGAYYARIITPARSTTLPFVVRR